MTHRVTIELESKHPDAVAAALKTAEAAIRNGCKKTVIQQSDSEASISVDEQSTGAKTAVQQEEANTESRVDDETQMLVKDAINDRIGTKDEIRSGEQPTEGDVCKSTSVKKQIDKQIDLAESVSKGVHVGDKIIRGSVKVIEGASDLIDKLGL